MAHTPTAAELTAYYLRNGHASSRAQAARLAAQHLARLAAANAPKPALEGDRNCILCRGTGCSHCYR